MTNSPEKFSLNIHVEKVTPACAFLAEHCHLSKIKIKDAMLKGAVHLKRPGQKQKRIRKATFSLFPGDCVKLHYDEKIIALRPLEPTLLFHQSTYSVWHKPPGLLTQGSKFGDHCSLQRMAKRNLRQVEDIKIVQRLDREVEGLVLVTHNRKSAALFSQLFKNRQIKKEYFGFVEGYFGKKGEIIRLTKNLDEKEAVTIVTIKESSSIQSELDIELLTGRKHQIRRHLSSHGFPLVGDRKYGAKKSVRGVIMLLAYRLSFSCPFTNKAMVFTIPQPAVERFRTRQDQ